METITYLSYRYRESWIAFQSHDISGSGICDKTKKYYYQNLNKTAKVGDRITMFFRDGEGSFGLNYPIIVYVNDIVDWKDGKYIGM